MSLSDYKLTDGDISTKGVVAAPDKLTGTAAQNKSIFDRLIREVFKGLYNSLIDAVQDALDAKQGTLTFDSEPTAGSNNPVTSDGIKAAIDAIQPQSLTFDETPTAGSTNPVTSRGIKSAIDAITPPSITLDNVPTAGSDNPVKSQGIKSWTEALLAAAVYASIGGGY